MVQLYPRPRDAQLDHEKAVDQIHVKRMIATDRRPMMKRCPSLRSQIGILRRLSDGAGPLFVSEVGHVCGRPAVSLR